MAIYHLSAQIIGKGAGRSAVAAAAYRHCAKMDRVETGEEIDYTRKGGNAHSEFALPENAPAWITEFAAEHTALQNSAYFWNTVEANETRRDAQLMREFVLALPNELSTEQNIELVRDFVEQELSANGIVTDWAYHDMPNNPHVHLMTSLRPLSEEGFGAKRVPVLGDDGEPLRGADGKIRYEQFTGGMERLKDMRKAWAENQNRHLAKHGHDIRVDHRSFDEMGIDAVPSTHRGPAADNMDTRGEPSELVEKARIVSRENYNLFSENPDHVLKKITVQKAVFTTHDIAREIHKTECSASEFQALLYRVGASEELVPIAAPAFDPFTGEATSEALYSTKTMVELEHNMVRNIQSIASKPGVQIHEDRLEDVYTQFETKRGFSLNEQQKMVVRHLTGDASAASLVGYAGAGKSTTIDATRMALEQSGYKVIGGASAGIAAENLRAEAGVESRTLASWEYQWKKGELLPDNKTIFIMDEAGMVSSRQMENITRQLNDVGARVITLGDAKQLQPIQAGAAFRAFVDVTGYVELDSVVRQSEPWMREAAIAFGSGRAETGVRAYLSRDKFDWSDTNEDARAELIQDWVPYYQANADVSIMAHRNKDVIALNMEARHVLKDKGALGEDHSFLAERGERDFADGDRVLFLKNERSLGVFNGTNGTVVKADENRLEVIVDGRSDPITIRANEYNTIDHGYARTIHKEQGNTVDQSFVYLSPTMDAQLSYVALTRHRDDVKLYASHEDFNNTDEMFEAMTRDRLQDTTVLYRDKVDYQDVVQGFAKRRGFPTSETIVEFVKSNVAYLRERYEKVSAAFERLRKPSHSLVSEQAANVTPDKSPDADISVPDKIMEPPQMSVQLNQAVQRLFHDLAHDQVTEQTFGRKGRAFKRSAHYELNMAASANELREFNKSMRDQIGMEIILSHGSSQPSKDASFFKYQPSAWQEFAIENWDKIFAAQWAETQASLEPLRTKTPIKLSTNSMPSPKDEGQSVMPLAPKENQPINAEKSDKQIAKPLIEAVPDMPALTQNELRALAIKDESLDYSLAISGDVAGRIYKDKDEALTSMLDRYAETGNAPAIISELEREPERYGHLKGGKRLGVANKERRNALEQSTQLAEKAIGVFQQIAKTETAIITTHDNRRAAMARPLPDLSKNTQLFLERVDLVNNLPTGEAKTEQMKTLLSNKQSLQEINQFRADVKERYGKGRSNIQKGLSSEPALRNKTMQERNFAISRVNTILRAVPVIGQMQDRLQHRERSRSVGKDQSRGIEH